MASERSSLQRYLVALGCVVFAILLRFPLAAALGNTVPFILYFPAVVVAAHYGGLGPGLAAMLVSASAAWFLGLSVDALQLGVFLIVATFMTLVNDALRQAQRRAMQSEEQQRNERELLHVTLSSIGDAVIATQPDGTVTFMNSVAESLTGWAIAEAAGRRLPEVFRILNEHLRKEIENPVERVIREGQVVGLGNHTVLIAKDGSERPIDDSAAPIRDARGQIVGAVLVFRDITERRSAEHALAHSYERTESILASISDAFYVLDSEWRFTYVNEYGAALARKPREELLGKVCWEVFPDVVGTPLQRDYERAMAERIPVSGEFYYPKYGVWFSHRIYPSAEGVSSYVTDITARKNQDEERDILLAREQAARRDAEQANRLKDEFLATLSHELRTPLTAILGWSRIVRAGNPGPDAVQRAIEAIDRNAEAQRHLIEDLLDVSAVITGKVRLDMQPVSLATVIEAAQQTVKPAAEAKGIHFETTLDPEAGLVSGDAARLQQVVWNLLSNAVKFTPSGGCIEIRLERLASHIQVVVSDTGQGIDQEFLPYVFDRFRQADSSTTRRSGGLGLGLAIVRHLVELHGGVVSVTSLGRGHGATFTVRLPLMVSHGEQKTEQRVKAQTNLYDTADQKCLPELEERKVLVVDDQPDTLLLLQTVLEECGADVRSTLSSSQALSEVKTWKPDVIVCDIGMPEEDGYAFIQHLRELEGQDGQIPAVALTAYVRPEDRTKALTSGYQMYLAKPFEPMELAAVISSLLRLKPQQR
jgi:PAS domain S-box-containing protein